MAQTHFDVVVIGSGPGGEGAAMQAVKQGKSVAVVERYRQIGGACTHLGTIPSKALRYAIYSGLGFYVVSAAFFSIAALKLRRDWVD